MDVFKGIKKFIEDRMAGGGAKTPFPASVVFERFREVLNCNNKALEIIADLGEKLSGDYIFDKQYINDSMKTLEEAVLQSVHALNSLSSGRYQELYAVYDRLTSRLHTVMAGREDRTGPIILDLKDITRPHAVIVGGKNSHLAQIAQNLGLKVPDGFVITTRAYHDLVDHNGLRRDVDAIEAMMDDPDVDVDAIEPLRIKLETSIAAAKPPPDLISLIGERLDEMKVRLGQDLMLAVRSSAQEEDMDFSFAGQFHTVLNVPADPLAVFDAYRSVAASLFGRRAIRYRLRVFPGEGHMSIAAGCYRMVDSKISGIVYTVDPSEPGGDTMMIVSVWGQGEAVVEGRASADTFYVKKGANPLLVRQKIAVKETGLYLKQGGGLETRPVPDALKDAPSLTVEQLEKLSIQAMQLENYYRRPQDIEWAIDGKGDICILQSRPLVVADTMAQQGSLAKALQKYELIVADTGAVAQQGIGVGPVYIVETVSDLDRFPEGAVLVSRRDSSQFIRVMHKTAAIVTEVGTPVSHMSTLCRELQIPCLVNVNGILSLVQNGMEVTVDAEDRRIYKGRVPELLAFKTSTNLNIAAAKEFRILKRLLNTVSSLNLVDPLMDNFVPEACETYHDILRFVHEKAVGELVEMGRDERCLLKDYWARPLDFPIPVGILVIDMGGGVSADVTGDKVPFSAITSIPFKTILEGLMFPGVWHTRAANIGFGDLVTSIVNVPTDALCGQYSGHNIAIITNDYLNLSLRFGYHFNIIDVYCSDRARDNHIYFRFLGGATDITKRSRRARLIAIILEAFGFNVESKGDIVIARSGNMPKVEIVRTLNILGRLVGFTRQLDVQMDSDEQVDRYAEAFLMGDYEIVNRR
ncbi:MAG: PEP/pyruvate-binding domain-containing protein [Dissulfurimicrobium hydrothermale]|uniref:PEP/pyruvate-binding domain-containing protein n=1 Tax=Dissulfurimicrobium hydrothermale TaxID=1750598 RepID=UPI003C720636